MEPRIDGWTNGPAVVFAAARAGLLPVIRELATAAGLECGVDGPLLWVATDEPEALLARVRASLAPEEATQIRALAVVDPTPSAELLGKAMLAPSLAEAAGRSVTLDLREDARFYSRYQPVIDLRDGRVRGWEALLRADRGGLELTAPELLRIAAAGGWLTELDRIGREHAIRGAGPWLGGHLLFVNMLPSTLVALDDASGVMDLVTEVGISAEQLVIELVEWDGRIDPIELRTAIDRFRAAGAKLALDDVGTGTNTLHHVAALQPDIIKLDGSLVQAMPDSTAEAVLRAVISLGHEIGATVVAEWVETGLQADLLGQLGAHWCQGWYVGRAVKRDA